MVMQRSRMVAASALGQGQPAFESLRFLQYHTGMRSGGRDYDGPGVEKLQLLGSALHPVTRRLVDAGRPIEIAGARAVRERAGAPAGMRREALLWTGEKGWLAATGPNGPDFRAPRVGLQSLTVGLAIEVDGEAQADAKEPPRQGQVVLVTGVFCNNAGLPFFGDLAFNICNWMVERRVLLDIRGSKYEAKHMQLQPQQLHRIWWLLEAWVPGAFFVLGCVVFWMRRRI